MKILIVSYSHRKCGNFDMFCYRFGKGVAESGYRTKLSDS